MRIEVPRCSATLRMYIINIGKAYTMSPNISLKERPGEFFSRHRGLLQNSGATIVNLYLRSLRRRSIVSFQQTGVRMDTDRLNRWLTLVANIGVLIGIFLLILEINQNNDLMRIQIEQSRSESFLAWQRQAVADDSIARFLVRIGNPEDFSLESFQQLSPAEQIRARYLISSNFYDFENTYAQYERGFVSKEYWQERIAPVIRERAHMWKAVFSPDGPSGRRAFKEEVERILREHADTLER